MQTFSFELEEPVKFLDIRLGPIPTGTKVKKVMLNGRDKLFSTLHAGDSDWIWVKNVSGKKGKLNLLLEDK